MLLHIDGRRVLRYQRGNQKPYIEEEQTIQWPKTTSTTCGAGTAYLYKAHKFTPGV
jgi:hypothetical protein